MDSKSFYENMAEVYHHIFPVGKKADFIQKKMVANSRVIDIGCSDGRVAKELVVRGYEVTGIDLSEEMVQVAKKISEDGRLFKVKTMDMIQIEAYYPKGHFDGAYCIGNTLVHLSNEGAIDKTIRSMANILKPGGKLVIQIINYDHIFSEQVKVLPMIENEFVKFERFYDLMDEKVGFRTVLEIKRSNHIIEKETYLFPIRKNGLENLLLTNGFSQISWYGGFDGRPFTKDSLPLIVVGVKA